ncbi:MAG: site-specific DNA-methyltransferase [Planctomycetota bacterium]
MAGLAMPLQKIETVDQPRSEAAAAGQLDLFEKQKTRLDDFRNMLIWGDNKLVMASLLKDFKGKVDLIYIDPPFDVGADFTMTVPVGDEKETVFKDQSTLEMVAYRDTWGRGTDSYLSLMCERLVVMKELLSDKGSIYVHCDYRVNSHLKLILYEILDQQHFRNEIVWQRTNAHNEAGQYGRVHDTLLFATKTDSYVWHPEPVGFSEVQLKRYRRDEKGRLCTTQDLTAERQGSSSGKFEWRGTMPTPGRGWGYTIEQLEEWWAQGRIATKKDGTPRMDGLIVYLDEKEGQSPMSIWTDIERVANTSPERLGYNTQKPEALLDRIIKASSDEGDLVADFFCGSGTTGAVAERLRRRWIMCDLGRFAIHTSRKRLIEVQRKLHADGKPYRAFDVFNLGRYERQWWQKERLRGADEEHRRVVLEFYKAEVLTNAPSPLIHGRKGAALCHVDGIDSVFNRGEVAAVAKAAKEAGAKEVACLAWEFEMDLRMECNRLEKEHDIKIKLIQIPREIMEKNRKEPPPFLEVATLAAEPVYHRRGGPSPRPSPSKGEGERAVDIKLTRFIPSLAEVPTKELEALQERAVKSGFDFIDFWAVDFDFKNGGPFNHHWQDYRTRKDRSLKTVSDQGYVYPKKARYTACVKVVDIFGCDTSITVEVVV